MSRGSFDIDYVISRGSYLRVTSFDVISGHQTSHAYDEKWGLVCLWN